VVPGDGGGFSGPDLEVKKSWLYDTVESGALEAVRLGKQLRFRPSAVARYLDASTAHG
jgi:excisionase family DNA binding protein